MKYTLTVQLLKMVALKLETRFWKLEDQKTRLHMIFVA